MKIAIVGYSGSGKSTTARTIGEKLNIPVLHLDSVHWMAGWTERPTEDSQAIVARFLAENDSWVIDGNYKLLHQTERLESADVILFFDFPATVCLYRAVMRWLKYRGTTRPDLATDCNEKIDSEFIRWIVRDGRTEKKQKSYQNMCKKYSNKIVILKTQRQVDDFLKTL